MHQTLTATPQKVPALQISLDKSAIDPYVSGALLGGEGAGG